MLNRDPKMFFIMVDISIFKKSIRPHQIVPLPPYFLSSYFTTRLALVQSHVLSRLKEKKMRGKKHDMTTIIYTNKKCILHYD